MDGGKLIRTRTVRRFPEGPERWNQETMQRFAVNVANPTSIPDVPSSRRDVSEHDELDERLGERIHAERQRHVPTSSAEPSRTESDRQKNRKRDPPDDNGIRVRRKCDEEGDAESLLEDGLMMTRTTDTFDPQYIRHDEWILQESYVEPIQVFPILHEPKLDATRTGGLNEELVSKAMKAEMESFRKFDVYDEVDIDDLTLEERSKIIGGRWVLTPKSDTVVKARYVAQGYAQYVEPDDVCATTLSPTTLRLCLIIAIQRRYHMQTWDVSTAFLHATRSEEKPIYLRPPMEFYEEESTLWRVKRAVYGLKTSPREWQDCFATTMTKNLGMTRSRIDANLFTKTIGNELIMLLVYVDDLFILGPNDESNEMLRLLQEHFAMKQTGELIEGSEVQFLGRTIKRDLDSISFSTSTNYVTALVDLLGITDNLETRITGSSSPFPKSDDANSLNPADHSRYRRAVGMLQWIVPTRPDMAFATKERARALASPTIADMTALRLLVRYYRTTSDLELRIQPKTRTRVPEGEPELLSFEAYSDSDWAGCRDTRRSTSGGIIYFEGAVLTFWSRTQTSIALSSCEAELYAINMATIEALNVKSTIEELINNCKTNITVYTDSSSAKSITSRRGVTRKTKHIELRQLFVQELVANGTLQMTKVGTLSHPADIFTQFVSSETIQRQLHAVGLRCTKLIHAIQAIRCVPSDFVEVSETQAHETRAMAMLNFDVTKFLEAERPKYDVNMFGDPYQVWYDDREKVITFCCITPDMTDYTTVFEIDEEVVTTAKIMAKCEMNTKLHWSIFNDDDDIFPTQIAYRAMTNFSYANGRAKNGCPICARPVPDDYKTYRDVREMPKDDLTNMIRLVSEPYLLWRSEVIDDNANLDDSRPTKKTDDSNKDMDEKEPKVPFELTAIPDRREGVLNDTAESVISSIYT